MNSYSCAISSGGNLPVSITLICSNSLKSKMVSVLVCFKIHHFYTIPSPKAPSSKTVSSMNTVQPLMDLLMSGQCLQPVIIIFFLSERSYNDCGTRNTSQRASFQGVVNRHPAARGMRRRLLATAVKM